jgi:type II secretory pathway pseudopilin PulG
LIEILVVMAIIAAIAGLVTIGINAANRKAAIVECVSNVRDLASLLESAQDGRYPEHDGVGLILYLVAKGYVQGPDALEKLFCPGDLEESLDRAGGEAAYAGLDPSRAGEYGHLTSYAGRRQRDKACRASKNNPRPTVLLCDDSEDHHEHMGIVVGLTSGAAKFRDKLDDYKLASEEPILVGEGSNVEELSCMRAD